MTTQEILFGTKLCPINAKEMARLTGVSATTIARWRKKPGLIPLGKLRIIARLRKLTAEELTAIVKETS